MISTYHLIEKQIQQLNLLESDLTIINQQLKDNRTYLEHEAEIAEEKGDEATAERYYEKLTELFYPVRKLEFEIRHIKRSIVEDYAELVLTSTGDIRLANSILKAKRNIIRMDEIIDALQRKFNK